MRATRSVVEEARVRSVELVQAVQRVLRGMGVHYIEQHVNAELMGSIDQLFQLARSSVPTESKYL